MNLVYITKLAITNYHLKDHVGFLLYKVGGKLPSDKTRHNNGTVNPAISQICLDCKEWLDLYDLGSVNIKIIHVLYSFFKDLS